MKKFLLKLFLVIMLRDLHKGLRVLFGVKSLAQARCLQQDIELQLCRDNPHLKIDMKWETIPRGGNYLTLYAQLVTIKECIRIGDLLVAFKAIEYPRIKKELDLNDDDL